MSVALDLDQIAPAPSSSSDFARVGRTLLSVAFDVEVCQRTDMAVRLNAARGRIRSTVRRAAIRKS